MNFGDAKKLEQDNRKVIEEVYNLLSTAIGFAISTENNQPVFVFILDKAAKIDETHKIPASINGIKTKAEIRPIARLCAGGSAR